MRIVLQHKETGLYFEDMDIWSPHSSQALEFISSNEAMDFCLHNNMRDVQIVLKFDLEKYDIVMQESWKSLPAESRTWV